MHLPNANRSRLLLLGLVLVVGAFSYISYYGYLRPRTSLVLHPPMTFPANASEPDISRILLVSALFPSNTSALRKQLPNFFSTVTTEIYLFTTPDMAELVRAKRGALPITLTFASPFDIPPLAGLEAQYDAMRIDDRARPRPSSATYAARNAKPYFLDEAVRNTKDEMWEHAFWVNVNALGSLHSQWPDVTRLKSLWTEGQAQTGKTRDRLLFFPIAGVPHNSMSFWNAGMGPVDSQFLDSTFFGGAPAAVAWWRHAFYAQHDRYLGQALFVGSDTAIANSLALLAPSSILGVWPGDPVLAPLGSCGDVRRYYQFFLADDETRMQMRDAWDARARWSWDFWRSKPSCRLVELVSAQSVLARLFGSGWHPPASSVDDM